MTENDNTTRGLLKYLVNIIILMPFLVLLFTGFILLFYHVKETSDFEMLGLSGKSWLFFHKTFSIINLPLIALHLILHYNWLEKLFTFKLKNKNRATNITLFVLFFLCVVTSFLSWFVFKDSAAGDGLRGIHNKFGLLLIVFFVMHLIAYSGWLIKMTKKILQKDNDPIQSN